MSFKDKTIVITGASGGIGGETARLFAGEGANVVVNYFSSPEKAEVIIRELEEAGCEAFAFKADVSSPEEVKAMMEAAVERFGRIDVLVNCAAKHPPPMFDFKDPDWEYWKCMAHVNVMGVLVCSHCATSPLRESGGNIVNVVMDWDAGGLGYTLTKTAGTPLTRGLARELAPIRVNAVSPGAVDTWGMTDEEKEYFTGITLLKRVGQPVDIAKAILFLASEDASFITGATIQVDGGTRLLV
ncbi:MAG: SDR family oxidoreductase [Candidatus Bathyarchaeota archaeon]|nr:MAG: SDR family oxidoreductase [Candidatus Bathyarchaeota archaeon]